MVDENIYKIDLLATFSFKMIYYIGISILNKIE